MKTSTPTGRQCMAALVLGTALGAVGVSSASAADRADVPEQVGQAINNLSRYCTVCWRNARLPTDSWNDCTQEVLCRLMQTVPLSAWAQLLHKDNDERRELVRAIDAVKKRTQRSLKRATALTVPPADDRDTTDQQRRDERALIARAAEEVLSSRQQRILQLSFEGWSVHEIAAELALAPERISDEKYKAIRKLREHLQAWA